MSISKSITLYTALDNGVEDYVAHLEESLGKIDECHDASDINWFYNDEIGRDGILKNTEKGDTVSKFHVATENATFYLTIHQKQGKPFIAELDDFGSDRYSYAEMFTPHFNFAKEIGNTYCEGFSENFDDNNKLYIAYDQNGNSIEYYGKDKEDKNCKNAMEFAKNVIGLDFMKYGARIPELYIEPVVKDIKQEGYLKEIEKDDEDYRTYNIAHKEGNEYITDLRIAMSRKTKLSPNFEEQLTATVKNEDFVEDLKDYTKNSKKLSELLKDRDYDYDKASKLKEKRRALHAKIYKPLQDTFEKNIIWEKKYLEIKNNKLVETKKELKPKKKLKVSLKQKQQQNAKKQKSLGNDNEIE